MGWAVAAALAGLIALSYAVTHAPAGVETVSLLLLKFGGMVLIALCAILAWNQPVAGLVALAVFIPLEISRGWIPYFQVYDPRSGNFFSWFYLEDIAAWLLIFVWAFTPRDWRSPIDRRLLIGIAVFTAYLLFSGLRGPVEVARYSMYIQLKYLGLFAAVAALSPTLRSVTAFRGAMLGMGVVVAVITAWEFATGNHVWFPGSFYETGVGGDVWSTFTDRNNLARYLIIVMVFALCAARRLGAIAWAIVGLAFAAIVFTRSRSGLATSAGAVLLVLLYQRRSLKVLLMSSVALTFIAIVVFKLAGSAVSTTAESLRNIQGDRGWLARSALVLAGLQMFASEPLFGVGLDQFPIVFRARFGNLPAFAGLANSHTSIITILAEMGVVGLAMVAYLYWSGWRCFRRSARDPEKAPLAIALWVGSLVILAMSQTEGRLLGDTNLWLFFGLLSSVAAASTDSMKAHEGHSPE